MFRFRSISHGTLQRGERDRQALSRRRALLQIGAGGLGTALAARTLTVGAQEATPQVTSEDLPPVLADWIDAWATLDVDGIVAAFAEDGVHEDTALNVTFVGREEIRGHYEPLRSQFTDPSGAITNVIVGGDGAAVEWVFTGTYTGAYPGFPPGSGEEVVIRGTMIAELADGQIQRARQYYDVFGILLQLGAVPAPGAATPAT